MAFYVKQCWRIFDPVFEVVTQDVGALKSKGLLAMIGLLPSSPARLIYFCKRPSILISGCQSSKQSCWYHLCPTIILCLINLMHQVKVDFWISNLSFVGTHLDVKPWFHHLDDSASCAQKEPSGVVRLLWMSDLEANYICCTSELVVLSGMAENSGRRKKKTV